MKSKRSRNIHLILVLGGALLTALFISRLPASRRLELSLLDYRFRVRGPRDIHASPLVILAIDDQSDASTPRRWPWPRDYFAHVIRNLEQAGAAAIGIDVIFDQPQDENLRADTILARVLETNRTVVLAGKLQRDSEHGLSTLVPPWPFFTRGGTPWGLVSSELDDDGFFRRYHPLQVHADSVCSSFALQLLRLYMGLPDTLSPRLDRGTLTLGQISIPLNRDGAFLINFAGPAYSFPVYSFETVLDDKNFDLRSEFDLDSFDDPGDSTLGIPPGILHAGVLKNKIVLIGSTMLELHDDFPTPFLSALDDEGISRKALMPGVEVHANAIQTILDKAWLHDLALLPTILIVIILLALLHLSSLRLPLLLSIAALASLVLIFSLGSLFVFVRFGLIVEMVFPLASFLLFYTGETAYLFMRTREEKRQIRGAFSHYVPEKVVQEILAHPENLALGGEEREVSVLFSDLADFTSLSEKIPPAELVLLLNDYLSEMSEIILDHDGIIDKYEGDAIMAEFGVPIRLPDHAGHACAAAIRMQQRLASLRVEWTGLGRPQLRARIGINSGRVIAGNMGSRDVFDYTVLGDAVNLGSRLEGANKFYGTEIIISQDTLDFTGDEFHTRMLDRVRVKGKREVISIHELIAFRNEGLPAHLLELLRLFQEGMLLYQKQDWTGAEKIFKRCQKLRKDDGPARIYLERCRSFAIAPPPSDWDGVTEFHTK